MIEVEFRGEIEYGNPVRLVRTYFGRSGDQQYGCMIDSGNRSALEADDLAKQTIEKWATATTPAG